MILRKEKKLIFFFFFFFEFNTQFLNKGLLWIKLFFKMMLLIALIVWEIRGQAVPYEHGKFEPTDASLAQYEFPEWFVDAKFGIWQHWGPSSVPRHGNWYAHNMYLEGQEYYNFHVKKYGHPSKFGFKDIIPLWKAERWDPDHLMQLYKEAGAKYFFTMGIFHDNFALYNSSLNHWNAVNMGPKKDIVGIWKETAKKYGLPFGISEHLGASYTWYQVSHGSDKKGPLAGVPYDGANPDYYELYYRPSTRAHDNGWLTKDMEFQFEWYFRIKEIIDKYRPDILYSDSFLPYGDLGRAIITHLYNLDLNGEKKGVVYNCKEHSNHRFVEDLERRIENDIQPLPWQTDTSIGDWFISTGYKYLTSMEVVSLLVDIVSKNGNLLINMVQTPEGDLEDDVLNILAGITRWMKDNSVGIYETRAWKKYKEEAFTNGEPDYRFTIHKSKKTLYAFAMKHPTQDLHIKLLGLKAETTEKITGIRMLGNLEEKIEYNQTDAELIIKKPQKLPEYEVIGFAIDLAV
jgi:alpha-L-fucosidase